MKARTCKNCRFFKVVYDKCRYRFIYSLMYPLYYCSAKDDMIDCKTVCEKWQTKKVEYDISPQRLEGVEQDIKA